MAAPNYAALFQTLKGLTGPKQPASPEANQFADIIAQYGQQLTQGPGVAGKGVTSSPSMTQNFDPNAPYTYLGVTYPSYNAFKALGPYAGATNALTPHHATVPAERNLPTHTQEIQDPRPMVPITDVVQQIRQGPPAWLTNILSGLFGGGAASERIQRLAAMPRRKPNA